MARVQFEHVYKQFGKVEIVHNINLGIQDKEFLFWLAPLVVGKVRACVWWQD